MHQGCAVKHFEGCGNAYDSASLALQLLFTNAIERITCPRPIAELCPQSLAARQQILSEADKFEDFGADLFEFESLLGAILIQTLLN